MRFVLSVALVGLVVCVGCGINPEVSAPPSRSKGIAQPQNQEAPQSAFDKDVAAIKELGGRVTVDEKGGVRVDLRRTKVTDAGLVHLKGLTNLTSLNLYNTKVTDSGLVHLEGLTNLEKLNLERTKVTDTGLVHLKGLTKLELLRLSGTTDAGLVHLKGLTNLTHLLLISTGITDAGLVHLKRLANLETLDLLDTKVTGAGFKKLQQALPNCHILR